MRRTLGSVLRLLSILTAFVALLSMSSAASAAGRVQWKSTNLDEREDGSWRIEITIHMGRAPDMAHVPMRFEFMPTVYYERALVDGTEGPVLRNLPLVGQQALVESVDVGFMDPGSGKIENRTKFSFKVTRGHGYNAGEYRVTIRDGRTGGQVGTVTTLRLKGENEVIDRRSIIFTGEPKKKKKKDEEKAKDEADASPEAPEAAAEEAEEDYATDDTADPAPADEPPPVEGKPGGCGCRAAGPASADGAWMLALGLALVLAWRRKG